MEQNFKKAAEIVQYGLTERDQLKHTVVNGVSVYVGNDEQAPGMDLKNEYFSINYRGYDLTFTHSRLHEVEYPDDSKSWMFDLPTWLDDTLKAIKGGEPAEHDYSIQAATGQPYQVETVKTIEVNNPEDALRIARLEGEAAALRLMLPSTDRVTYLRQQGL